MEWTLAEVKKSDIQEDRLYDAGPTGCGELLIDLFMTMKNMKAGEIIKVVSYDPGVEEDIPSWCRMQGHRLLDVHRDGGAMHFYIEKQ